MDRWTDGRMDGRMDGRTDGWMDGNSPLCSTGLRPLWVRCPASLCITFKNDEQGTGIADHMISLDYLLFFTDDEPYFFYTFSFLNELIYKARISLDLKQI